MGLDLVISSFPEKRGDMEASGSWVKAFTQLTQSEALPSSLIAKGSETERKRKNIQLQKCFRIHGIDWILHAGTGLMGNRTKYTLNPKLSNSRD